MSDVCNKVSRFGKGIGNESRYRILEALFDGPRTVNEIVTLTGQSQPAVSQHLRTLKESDLVTDERCGQEVRYTLNAKHMLTLLKQLIEEINHTKN